MPKKTWTDNDLEYLERVAGKVPVPVIANALNKTAAAVSAKGYSLGLKLHVPMRIMQKHWPELVKKDKTDAT